MQLTEYVFLSHVTEQQGSRTLGGVELRDSFVFVSPIKNIAAPLSQKELSSGGRWFPGDTVQQVKLRAGYREIWLPFSTRLRREIVDMAVSPANHEGSDVRRACWYVAR